MHRSSDSTFAEHLYNTEHSFGPMERSMGTWQFVKEGKFINYLEKKNFIYYETVRNKSTKDLQQDPIKSSVVT
jgi:hypothetical protein